MPSRAGSICAWLIASAAVACTSADPPGPADKPVVVKVIGFNDYHGNLQSPGTFGRNTAVPAAQRRRSSRPAASRD